MVRRHDTAAAFKQALEHRLRTASLPASTSHDAASWSCSIVILAWVALKLGAITLKGGLAVELRIERARTTNHIDLRVVGSPDATPDTLRAAVA